MYIFICPGTLLLSQAVIHSLGIINKIVEKRQGLLSSLKRLESKLSVIQKSCWYPSCSCISLLYILRVICFFPRCGKESTDFSLKPIQVIKLKREEERLRRGSRRLKEGWSVGTLLMGRR